METYDLRGLPQDDTFKMLGLENSAATSPESRRIFNMQLEIAKAVLQLGDRIHDQQQNNTFCWSPTVAMKPVGPVLLELPAKYNEKFIRVQRA